MTLDPNAAESSKLSLLKGTADQAPARMMRRLEAIAAIRDAFERFGFNPLETPMLAHMETLAHKYQAGDPILQEVFHVTDRGRRDLGLRYDLTVPFCRFVGMQLQGQFTLPFKRYEIGKVFRDGPIREGRLREFVQCDADVVGVADPAADAECLALADDVFTRLGIDAEIELNNRKILWAILESAGLNAGQWDAATTAVDKWDKVGPDGVRKEMLDAGFAASAIGAIFAMLEIEGEGLNGVDRVEEKIGDSELFRQGRDELRGVLEACAAFGLKTPVRIAPRLARGLGIYTGTIFEFFCRDRSLMSSSIGSGGRYDRIVGEFLHPDDPAKQGDYPCVGMSFGIEPMSVVLDKIAGETNERQSVVEVLVVPMGTRDRCLAIVADLRRRGVKADIELGAVRLKKTFKRANAMGIPFLAILGETELAEGKIAFRDMESGEQVTLDLDRAAEEIALRCGIAG